MRFDLQNTFDVAHEKKNDFRIGADTISSRRPMLPDPMRKILSDDASWLEMIALTVEWG